MKLFGDIVVPKKLRQPTAVVEVLLQWVSDDVIDEPFFE
jgi:hypothetical protein